MKKEFTEFNVVVRSKENPVEARKMLAQYINPECPNCLDEADMEFISKQDYITAVPVEIALTVAERRSLQESNPNLKFIVTGVTEANAKTLVDNYGYAVLEPEPVPVEEEGESAIEFAGKKYTREELENIVANHEKAKKQVEELKKHFEADSFFRDLLRDGLFQYNIF